MLTSCEKIPLIIRAGMIAMNNTAMLTSKYSYYVCNRKPGDGLIAPLRSIVFFALRNAMNLSATLREPSHPSMR